MKGLLRVARTEVLEHRRQPWMLGVLAVNYVIWTALPGALFLFFDNLMADPVRVEALHRQLAALGVEGGAAAFQTLLGLLVSTSVMVFFTNLPLFVAYLAAYSVLNDRQHGTLPFLMLAPLSRTHLLAGKLVGAMAVPMVFHLVFVGVATAFMRSLDVLEPFSHKLGGSSAWWVAFLVGAPASALLVGAVGTVISAFSRDVRTAMQFTSFAIGLMSLAFGYVLVDAIPAPLDSGEGAGATVQLAFTGGALVLSALILLVGAKLVSRDINPT